MVFKKNACSPRHAFFLHSIQSLDRLIFDAINYFSEKLKQQHLNRLIHFFKNLLSLSYYEARGFLALLIISVIALAFLFSPKIFFNKSQNVEPAEKIILDSLAALFDNKSIVVDSLFLFDPNIIPLDSLMLLGIPEKVGKRLINYRNKGGRFYVKEDVKKIYGLKASTWKNISDYIYLPDSASFKKNDVIIRAFDINIVNSYRLKAVNMVGEELANRIINFRQKLGGFISIHQLDEIYGLSDPALKNIKSFAFVKEGFSPHLIKINHDDFETLSQHPYISDKLAEDIIRFREINSKIESKKVLENFKSIDKSNFERLIIYLDF